MGQAAPAIPCFGGSWSPSKEVIIRGFSPECACDPKTQARRSSPWFDSTDYPCYGGGTHGNGGDRNPRAYATLWRIDGCGRRHVQRRSWPVLRLSGAERGGEVDNHQDADRPARADLRIDRDSG